MERLSVYKLLMSGKNKNKTDWIDHWASERANGGEFGCSTTGKLCINAHNEGSIGESNELIEKNEIFTANSVASLLS